MSGGFRACCGAGRGVAAGALGRWDFEAKTQAAGRLLAAQASQAPRALFFFVLASVLQPLALVLLDALCEPYTSARGAGSPALDTLDNACSKLNDFWVDRVAVARLRAALQLALLSFASHVSSHW